MQCHTTSGYILQSYKLPAASMFQFLILAEIYRELIYLSEAVMDHQNVTAALE